MAASVGYNRRMIADKYLNILLCDKESIGKRMVVSSFE